MSTVVARHRAAWRWGASAVGAAAQLSVVRQPGVGGFDDPAKPERDGLVGSLLFGASALDVDVVDAERGEAAAHNGIVIAPVQVQGSDVFEEPGGSDGAEGGFQQADVVAVGSADGPADRHAVALGRDRPFPANLGAVRGIGSCALAPAGRFVKRSVERDLLQVEAHDAVKGG